ncbi:FUSC family protein [Verticiella sediminum]|uniref:FUSC family protein n=1 Tax=Verticiella sediminum TaxID=1247510 RepID=A0A556ABH9_9BURK|nr:FUSC family membrane protein [Verticiella sediminum]TSH90217.1 FUSC family protein [Verticiella sediminum]
MENPRAGIRKFIYGHYLTNGLRQSIGILLPPFIGIGVFDQPVMGMAAAFGALCVSVIDQPGPLQHRLNGMLGCALLGTLAALITGVATSWPALLLFAVLAQTFFFGMFSAFGRKGGLIGFACLLLMTLTMHASVTPTVAAWHALATLGGSLWYTAFSVTVSHLARLRDERQALAVALFATADYIRAKAPFYDAGLDLQSSYRSLIPAQSALAEQQQAARDLILREVSRIDRDNPDPRRVQLGNIFLDMVDLQETMLATYTDYDVLRRALGDADLMLFARDALVKLARELDNIGMAVGGGRPVNRSTSIKAELRALEYETVLLKRKDFPQASPEAWVVVVQILRRLRTAARLVERMRAHVRGAGSTELLLGTEGSLTPFISREAISLSRFTSNLKLSSPHLRYAIRLSLTVSAGLAFAWLLDHGARLLQLDFGGHGYWIVLTILVIMKPGFALSSQRNQRRLLGTIIGCALTAAVMAATQSPKALLAVMLVASILNNSFQPINYLVSAIFNTMLVLLSFHFLAPGSLMVVGERALDALVGSLLVWAFSYVLPHWENRSILSLARASVAANRRLLQVCRQPPPLPEGQARTPEPRNDVTWRLARRNAHTAFANFADAFYRMMAEPKSKRIATGYLNDLLVQNHMLAAQISSTMPLFRVVGPEDEQPAELRRLLDAMDESLRQAETLLVGTSAGPAPADAAPAPAPEFGPELLPPVAKALEPLAALSPPNPDDPAVPAFETAHLTHQLRQMMRTVQRVREDAYAVQASPGTTPAFSAQRAEPIIVPQG